MTRGMCIRPISPQSLACKISFGSLVLPWYYHWQQSRHGYDVCSKWGFFHWEFNSSLCLGFITAIH